MQFIIAASHLIDNLPKFKFIKRYVRRSLKTSCMIKPMAVWSVYWTELDSRRWHWFCTILQDDLVSALPRSWLNIDKKKTAISIISHSIYAYYRFKNIISCIELTIPIDRLNGTNILCIIIIEFLYKLYQLYLFCCLVLPICIFNFSKDLTLRMSI